MPISLVVIDCLVIYSLFIKTISLMLISVNPEMNRPLLCPKLKTNLSVELSLYKLRVSFLRPTTLSSKTL